MGLATAQARLLTITARKSDCEFLSMSYSHQKIALSRNMEKISTEYQNALNQTKLVYDYTGTNASDMDLTYGLLMSPSVYNDYYPKLVTDSKNRVILNSSYAAAARAAGIPAEGLSGTPSSDVRNKFIEGLASAGVITSAKAASIQGTTYSNAIGNGATTSATTSTTEVTYDQLLDLLDAKGTDSLSYGLTLGQGDNGYGANERLNIYANGPSGSSQEIETGNGSSTYTLNLTDLLKGDAQYSLSMQTRKGEKIPLTGAWYLQNKIVGTSENSPSVLNWMLDQFSTALGGTTQSDQALQYAYNAIYDMVYADNKITDIYNKHVADNSINDKKGDLKGWCNSKQGSEIKDALDVIGTGDKINKTNKYYKDKVEGSKDYLGFRYTYDYDHSGLHADRNDKSQISINLNNLAQVFLTAYVEYMQGLDNTNYSYNVGKKSDANLYEGDKDNKFKFTVVSGSEVDTDKQVEANFYDALFNRICLDGWTQNDQIEDKDYMQEMMKSGLIYISSIGDDGYYYQGNYSTDKYISEVKDDEAIAKAEAKYNTEKTKIENKEDTIDMKMKNLDTEISSLTTEYDTTKSVISKSIEKSFKRYDA